MDITSKNNDDGSIEIKVVLTPEDTMRLPNAMRVLDGANSCTEILLALTVMAQEMTFKQAEFQAALRQATAEKAVVSAADVHEPHCDLVKRLTRVTRPHEIVYCTCKPQTGGGCCGLPVSDRREAERRGTHHDDIGEGRRGPLKMFGGPNFRMLTRRHSGDRRKYVAMVSGSGAE